MPDSILEVHDLTRRFGGVTAVDGVTLAVRAGEALGVIGPNGAGKSTFVGLVSGALPVSAGAIRFAGTDITRLGPPARTRLGIGRTHQIPRPFGRMTVLENLVLAGRHAPGAERLATTRSRCARILDQTGLADVADLLAGRLPLLRRKRLELARALALRPRLLLLDEIGAGLVEHETAELIDLVRRLRTEVEAMVIVEHVMDVITACCDRTVVLNFGKLLAAGATREVLADATVAAVYLGTASATQPAPADANQPPPAGATETPLADASQPLPADARTGQFPPAGGPASQPMPSGNGQTAVHSGRPPAQPAGARLLDVRNVHVSYGGVRALRGVSLHLDQGEVVALLGANGAGKTTLARAISAAVPLAAGQVEFAGRRIDRLPAERVAPLGIAHCMEGRRIFGTLTVEENLVLAADSAPRPTIPDRLASTYEVFPDLYPLRSRPGTTLSGGQQQMLAIGRALMSEPRAIVFDEISLGLAPIAVDRLYQTLGAIRARGVAMLLIEQNLQRGLSLADRAYVLVEGQIALTGTPGDIRRHPALRSLYLGESGGAGNRTVGAGPEPGGTDHAGTRGDFGSTDSTERNTS